MANKKIKTGNSDLTAGLIVLLVGVVLLLKAVGFVFPFWFISWPMLFIAIGLVILVRHNFQNGFGFFLVIFGSVFLVQKFFIFPFEIRPYLIPGGLILFGLYLIFKKSRDNQRFNEDFFRSYNKEKTSSFGESTASDQIGASATNFSGFDHEEVLNAQALFTGIQRRIFSKNFKGGKVSAIFGGTDIDFSQADIDGQASINLEVAFGGVKLVVPPHWDVQVNIGTIFAAGVEDKRIYNPAAVDKSKVLKIYGSVVFGGLEIKSF
ncbi:MAG: LiaF transmembrane domain-containing protein [Cecembia sp.]